MYANNARIIYSSAVNTVEESIKRYGFRQPIVVDSDGVVIVGHTRLQAALQMALEEVPVHVADDLSEDEIKGYRLADNRTHEFSDWERAALVAEITDIDMQLDDEADLSLMTGFTEKELDLYLPPREALLDQDVDALRSEAAQEAAKIVELRVADRRRDRKIRCPSCGGVF